MNTTDRKNCTGCGKEASKLYQGNLCVQCLEQSFARLRPMIDEYRSMVVCRSANRSVPVSVYKT